MIHQESNCRDLTCFETYRKALDSGDAAAAGHSSSVKRRAVPLGIKGTLLEAQVGAALYTTLRFRIGDTHGLPESDIISAFESAVRTYLHIQAPSQPPKKLDTPPSEYRVHEPRAAHTETRKNAVISAFQSAILSHLGPYQSKKKNSQARETAASEPPAQEAQEVQDESEGDDSNKSAASDLKTYELKCGSDTRMVAEEVYNRVSTSPKFLRTKQRVEEAEARVKEVEARVEEAEARVEAQRQATQRSFDEWEASRRSMMELAAREAYVEAQFRASMAKCDAAGVLPLAWPASSTDLQTLPILPAQSVFMPTKWDFRTINLAFGLPILLSTSTQLHMALRNDPWSLNPLDDIADMLVWLNYVFDLLGTMGVPEWVLVPVLVASIWLMGGFEWLPAGGCSPVPLLLNGGQWLIMILMDNGGASVGVVTLGFFLWLVFLGLMML
ncbi:MAG: hypothetical protein Q9183_005225 [Haloplaca sp. 2 TL-2023]